MIGRYRADAPLTQASTIPAAWYVDPRVFDLERRTVFRRAWQFAGRLDSLSVRGDFITCELPGGEPIVVVRGADHALRAFYNVCRHHAAAVVTDPQGSAQQFRCPYHGWTYALDGALKGTPDFAGVCDFDRSAHGLIPVDCDVVEQWAFVRPDRNDDRLSAFLGPELSRHLGARGLDALHWMERRHYTLDCNWKVFVDNYLDGGYHVPHVHRGLDSVLSSRDYTIETGERFCLQWSPLVTDGAEARTGRGEARRARVLLLDLSELHDQLLRQRDGHEPRDSARRGQDGRHLRFLLHGRVRRRARREPGQHRRQPGDSGRGRGGLRVGAARSEVAAHTTPDDSRFVARPASISSIGCCTAISWQDSKSLLPVSEATGSGPQSRKHRALPTT